VKKLLAVIAIILGFAGLALGQATNTPNLQLQIPGYQQTNWQVPINYDMNLLDAILAGEATLPTGDTPTISQISNWIISNTTSTTITNFLGGLPGQTIHLFCSTSDSFTSIGNSANVSVGSSFNCTGATNSISFTLLGTVWTEISRSGGGGGGGGSPGGPFTSLQYNNSGILGGSLNLTFSPTSGIVESIPYTSTSAISVLTGFDLTLSSASPGGFITSVYGINVESLTAFNTSPTNATGIQVGDYGASGASTTYGLRILDQTQATTNWALYIDPGNGPSYFGGDVIIGGDGVGGTALTVNPPESLSGVSGVIFEFTGSSYTGLSVIAPLTATITAPTAQQDGIFLNVSNVLSGSSTYGSLIGETIQMNSNGASGSSILSNIIGINITFNPNALNTPVTNTTGFSVSVTGGTATGTNFYGFRVNPVTPNAGTTSWAFYADNAPSFFGGGITATGANIWSGSQSFSSAVTFQAASAVLFNTMAKFESTSGILLDNGFTFAPIANGVFGFNDTNFTLNWGSNGSTATADWIITAPTSGHLAQFNGTLGMLSDSGIVASSVPQVTQCGTVAANGACSNSSTSAEHCISGIATLSSGTSTITGVSPAFTSSSSFFVTTNDITTIANPSKGIPASGSSITFTGTGSDNIQFIACGG
jgi:hypothetical protein